MSKKALCAIWNMSDSNKLLVIVTSKYFLGRSYCKSPHFALQLRTSNVDRTWSYSYHLFSSITDMIPKKKYFRGNVLIILSRTMFMVSGMGLGGSIEGFFTCLRLAALQLGVWGRAESHTAGPGQSPGGDLETKTPGKVWIPTLSEASSLLTFRSFRMNKMMNGTLQRVRKCCWSKLGNSLGRYPC